MLKAEVVTVPPPASLEAGLAELADLLSLGTDGTVHDTVDALASCLPPAAREPLTDLRNLGRQVGAAFTVVRASGAADGYDDLRPDRALARLEGDELLVASLLVAIGRRRGYPVRVLRDRRHALVAAGPHPPTHVLSPRHESRCLPAAAFGNTRPLEGPALTAALLAPLRARAWRLGDRSTLTRLQDWDATPWSVSDAVRLPVTGR